MEFNRKLPIPKEIKELYPLSDKGIKTRQECVATIKGILEGVDSRMLLLVGPCSADREDAVLDYLQRLKILSEKVSDKIYIVPRLYTSKPRTSGNVYDYESWALECAGVGYVKVLRLWAGPGTVKVIVAGEDKLPVPETVRAAGAENIDAKRVIGPSVTVVSVTAVPVTITVSCILDSGASADGVEAALTDAVTALLAGFEPGEENTLRYNRILALALSAEGVVDVSALTVNGGTGNITITADQVPRLGAVTVTGVDYE